MSATAYIVPSSLLETAPPKSEWHATPVPSDPARSLVVIDWGNANALSEFEAQPGVLLLGQPWEPLPAEAVSLLASFDDSVKTDLGAGSTIPASDVPTAPDSVSFALRKVAWPGAKLVR